MRRVSADWMRSLCAVIKLLSTLMKCGCIRRILVTCDDDNIRSISTIERNGGVLENIVSGSDLPKPKRRYWIEVP